MSDETFAQATSSFIEQRGEKSYLEKDKSLVMKNELLVSLTEERITNNRLTMNIFFHFLVVISTSVIIWQNINLFSTREVIEGHNNKLFFSILDFSFYDIQKNAVFSFPYSCATEQVFGEIKKCLLKESCVRRDIHQPNIFEYFKDTLCQEFHTLAFFGIIVNCCFI
jgi:hypothetical protein